MVCHMESTGPELLTTEAMAEALRVSIRTVVRKVHAGDLTAAMKAPGLRGAYFFTPAERDRALQQRQAPPPLSKAG